jgi:DNA-binding MarR family transcriptional regulator
LAQTHLQPGASVVDAVTRLQRSTLRIANLRLQPWNVTLAGYVALRVIADRPDLSLAQLSRRCFVRPQTMTRTITRFVERGFIVRLPNPESERAMSLRVTELGQAALAEMGPEVNKINGTIDQLLDRDQIALLDTTLRELAGHVEAEIKEMRKSAVVAAGRTERAG